MVRMLEEFRDRKLYTVGAALPYRFSCTGRVAEDDPVVPRR